MPVWSRRLIAHHEYFTPEALSVADNCCHQAVTLIYPEEMFFLMVEK